MQNNNPTSLERILKHTVTKRGEGIPRNLYQRVRRIEKALGAIPFEYGDPRIVLPREVRPPVKRHWLVIPMSKKDTNMNSALAYFRDATESIRTRVPFTFYYISRSIVIEPDQNATDDSLNFLTAYKFALKRKHN